MMYAMADAEFFSNFLRIMGFIVLIYIIVVVLFQWRQSKRKNPQDLIHGRLWKRFCIANKEVLPILNDKERREMIQVFHNTVKNVTTLTQSKPIFNVVITKKNSHKHVKFSCPVQAPLHKTKVKPQAICMC